jgi:hypothetical protein
MEKKAKLRLKLRGPHMPVLKRFMPIQSSAAAHVTDKDAKSCNQHIKEHLEAFGIQHTCIRTSRYSRCPCSAGDCSTCASCLSAMDSCICASTAALQALHSSRSNGGGRPAASAAAVAFAFTRHPSPFN